MPEKRTYADRRDYLIKTVRKIHAGILQLSGEIQNEKWGEFRGALNGNPEPSLVNGIKVTKKVQRLRVRNQSNKL